MPVYTDKKTKRLYIEFQFKGERVKERLPKGTTKPKADEIEIKLKNEILERHHGLTPQSQMTFERFLKTEDLGKNRQRCANQSRHYSTSQKRGGWLLVSWSRIDSGIVCY